MVEIAGRPFLEYLLLQLRSQGYREIVLCTGYMGELVERYFGSGRTFGMEIRHSRESEARGTAGAIKLAEPLLSGERWLVMNGDSFFDIDFGRLVGFHQATAATATIALANVDETGRYGAVKLGDGGRIEAFLEKTSGALKPAMINGGIYVLERQVLGSVPTDRPVSLERDIFPALVGHGLHGAVSNSIFVDIGVPEDYLRLNASPGPLLRLLD
jgi:NDP-sugar pyrophosphorylase family protein